jgi:hypothetical protein
MSGGGSCRDLKNQIFLALANALPLKAAIITAIERAVFRRGRVAPGCCAAIIPNAAGP